MGYGERRDETGSDLDTTKLGKVKSPMCENDWEDLDAG